VVWLVLKVIVNIVGNTLDASDTTRGKDNWALKPEREKNW